MRMSEVMGERLCAGRPKPLPIPKPVRAKRRQPKPSKQPKAFNAAKPDNLS